MNSTESKPPPLNCGTFSGIEKVKFTFNTFLNQFNIAVGYKKHLSDATKLAYQIGYLGDYAPFVKHLSITDCNYNVAIHMLVH